MKTKLFCLALAILLLASGCSSAQPQRTLAERQQHALRIAVHLPGNMDQVIHRRNAAYSTAMNVELNDAGATRSDAEYVTGLINDFAAGNEPDVCFLSITDAATLIENRQVVSLNEITAVYPEFAANLQPEHLMPFTDNDGVVWCIPICSSYQALFCNLDLFEAHGLPLPEDFGTLMADIEAFRKAGVTPIAAGFADGAGLWADHLLLAAGPTDHENAFPGMTEIPMSWYSGLTLLSRLSEARAFPRNAQNKTMDEARADFLSGEAAMILCDGSLAQEAANSDRLRVLPFPNPAPYSGEKHVIIQTDCGFFLSRKAWENPETRARAMAYLQNLTTDEIILELCADGAALPTIRPENIYPADAETQLVFSSLRLACFAQKHTSLSDRLNPAAWEALSQGIAPLTEDVGTLASVLARTAAENAAEPDE